MTADFIFLLILLIFGVAIYMVGLLSTLDTIYAKNVTSFFVAMMFAAIPVFNIVYPLIYGIELKEEIKKVFKK